MLIAQVTGLGAWRIGQTIAVSGYVRRLKKPGGKVRVHVFITRGPLALRASWSISLWRHGEVAIGNG